MSFSDRTVNVNGLGLHYTEWGRPGAPAVVLLKPEEFARAVRSFLDE